MSHNLTEIQNLMGANLYQNLQLSDVDTTQLKLQTIMVLLAPKVKSSGHESHNGFKIPMFLKKNSQEHIYFQIIS